MIIYTIQRKFSTVLITKFSLA